METTARRPNFFWLALAALAFAVAFLAATTTPRRAITYQPGGAVSKLAVSAPSKHAVEKHGLSVWRVTKRLGDADPDDDNTWSKVCPDGRRYTFHRTADGQAYDVSIDTPDLSRNFTRLVVTDANWIARKLAWCE